MAATCMAVCKGSRKKIRGIFISSCHLPVAVECDIVILSEPGPIPQAPVGQFCRHNLSPRGDGNLRRIGRSSRVPRHNLSPRGDGNQLLPAGGGDGLRHNLSPRGDGNSSDRIYRFRVKDDTTYPREGTETVVVGIKCNCGETQLIPARGRKRKSGRTRPQRPATQLIPARGRKHYEGNRETSLYGHNLSPRGDGNLLLLCSSVFAVEPDTTYPREGTETF